MADQYDAWLTVGMALHHESTAPAMLALWEEWSRQSGKHKPGDCQDKWASFRSGAENPVTIGSVVRQIRSGKWADQRAEAAERDEAEEVAAKGDQDAQRELLSRKLGVDIVRIEQAGRTNLSDGSGDIEYTMCIDHEGQPLRIYLGGSGVLHNRHRMRTAIEEATGHAATLRVDLFTAVKWESQVMPVLAKLVEVVDDVTAIERVRSWLEGYLDHQPPEPLEKQNISDVRRGEMSYIQEGLLWVRSQALARYLDRVVGEKYPHKVVTRTLRRAGFEKRTVRIPGSTRRYWSIPMDSEVYPWDTTPVRGQK